MSDRVDCPTCGGDGSVKHPRFGARTCPSPDADCPDCEDGTVTQEAAARINRKRLVDRTRSNWGLAPEPDADRADDDAAMRDDREDRSVWLGWESAR